MEEDNLSDISSLEDLPVYFRVFSRDSLKAIRQRIEIVNARRKGSAFNDDEDEEPEPDPKLSQGEGLPLRLATAFDETIDSLAGVPLEDIDPAYRNTPSFVIITKKKEIFRFSATDAMWLLSPFSPVRRVAVTILTHGLFSLTIITTILANCYVMIIPSSPMTESSEVIFTAIYTFEGAVKMMARGFILEKFTYLRDAWNWLDFVVVSFAYVTMGIDLGNLSALRTCRVFRALKTVAIVPGLKTIVGAVIESVKNLRDVIILTMFALAVFGLVGLQIYMGVLTQKCIVDFPEDGSEGEERDRNWDLWNRNLTNWHPFPPPSEYGNANYPLCGNSSGAGKCPQNHTCLQGYGPNPNYGYTSFDTFGSAFLSSFRLMTQDFWEGLYQQILRSAGPWHILFFLVIIFLGSYYLVNLILAIVAMSYDELEKRAEMDAMLEEQEREAMKQEEEARTAKLEQIAARSGRSGDPDKSPSKFSNRSYLGNLSGAGLENQGKTPRITVQQPSLSTASLYGSFIKNDPFGSFSNIEDTKRDGSVAILLPFCLTRHQGPILASDSVTDILKSQQRAQSQPPTISVTPGSQLSQRRDSEKTGYLHVDKEHPTTLKVPQERRDSIYTASDISEAPSEKDNKDVPLNELINQASRRASMLSQLDAARLRQAGQRPKLIEVIKAKVVAFSLKALDFFCLWDFGFPWNFFNQVVGVVVFDPFTELFITLAIVVNTVFMALDHYGLDEKPTFNAVLKMGNKVFTTIFTLECAMKLIAKSPKFFFQVSWNVFDFIIVAISLVELMFEDANLPGLSALRSFRLLRVFKLAKSWPTLNMLLTIMGQTVGSLTNLVIVLVIIIFIFAVMGMQLFAKDYFEKYHKFPGGEMPRWNFTDFGHSFMIIFRVLCGEWIESMWDCMLVAGAACVPYFLATVLVGNLVLLNLFLALLLSSFGASNVAPSNGDDGSNKLAEAFNRIARFKRWIVNGLIKCFKALLALIIRAKNRIIPGKAEKVEEVKEVKKRRRPKLKGAATLIMNSQKLGRSIKSMKEGNAWEQPEAEGKTGNNDPDSPDSSQLRRRKEKRKNHCENQVEVDTNDNNESDTEWTEDETSDDDDEDDDDEDDQKKKKGGEEEDEGPAQCMPDSFYERFPIFDVDGTVFGDAWNDVRLRMFRLIENKYFESAVIFLILLSSLALALEDVHLPNNPVLVDVLFYMDRVFTIIFFFEMLTKWMALGFVTYFTNAWCWLDFVIVMVSVINFVAGLFGAGNIQAFKTMRTLRALRPLRAMARMQGMRVVVNALIGAIPSISNVLMVCLIFWLIFAIMGVQLFSGKFQKCVDPADGSIPDFRIIRNKMECLANNYTWENSVMNFDHVGKAYLCLFQVATFKGWIGIMNDAIDSREIDEQPSRETSFVMYGYFVIFIIVGSFFTLNLFIGVIIDNFNEQQKKSGGSMEMFMTEDQKKYYSAMQKMGSKKPIKSIPKPIWKPQLLVFNVVTNQKFDMIIMLLIGVNLLVMTMDHYNMTEEWDYWLNVINVVFVAIFTAECCLKIFALRHYYFKEPWNVFDVIVVFMSLVGMVLSDLIEKYFVSPTLLRVVRVAKVGRILRLVKGAKGIRTLLFALAMSLPALFNICLLLFLVMFIYSIFGMSFFMNVKLRGALDDVYNFQTFGQSIILLFQMSTSAGWDGVLDGIMDEDDCEAPNPEEGNPGDCGSAAAGIAFLLSYLVISFLIIINMYIAVILDNYSQATEEVQEGLTDDDYDMYYEVWEQFDPTATQYIPYSQLLDLVDILEPPLQIHKPNKIKVVSMDIAICKGDLVYCVDILDALTKDFFARKGNPVEEAAEITEVQIIKDRPGYEPISSTLFRQREEQCARVIQRLWRRKRNERKTMNKNEEVKVEKT